MNNIGYHNSHSLDFTPKDHYYLYRLLQQRDQPVHQQENHYEAAME